MWMIRWRMGITSFVGLNLVTVSIKIWLWWFQWGRRTCPILKNTTFQKCQKVNKMWCLMDVYCPVPVSTRRLCSGTRPDALVITPRGHNYMSTGCPYPALRAEGALKIVVGTFSWIEQEPTGEALYCLKYILQPREPLQVVIINWYSNEACWVKLLA